LLVLIEGSFLPLVALSLARPIVQRRLRNNYPIVGLVMLIAACQWLTWLAGCARTNCGNAGACLPGCGWWRR
jgi:uncharacterized protein involved in response to NO